MAFNTLCIFGTRPGAIKMASVIQQLNLRPFIHNKICITGQHYQMFTPVLNLFGIKPDFNLQVMTANQDLSHLTARILTGLTEVYQEYKPDLVLVHGDTTTTLAASLSSYYHRIPVAHIEAGLRTGNILSPWPEEANRKLTGGLASLHFAPTASAKSNLLREGIPEETIHITGNTVIDALLESTRQLESNSELRNKMIQNFPFVRSDRKIILVTAHRRENFGEGFACICQALRKIAHCFPCVDIIYPVHLNPNVQKPVKELLGNLQNVYLIDPVDYLPFVYLMKSAYLILTDSGGIQEEAPSLGKPVLVMRRSTERPEAIDAGSVKLVGTDVNKIIQHVEQLLTDEKSYQTMSKAVNPYGDGQGARRIVQIISDKIISVKTKSNKNMEVSTI